MLSGRRSLAGLWPRRGGPDYTRSAISQVLGARRSQRSLRYDTPGDSMRIQAAQADGPVERTASKMRVLLEAIKFEHTIFALPFAYLGMVLAARSAHGWPGWGKLIWITIAMAAARTLAMALNRLIDASLDARNPRTANRALPRRLLRPAEVLVLAVVSGGVVIAAAAQLNPLCLKLVPVALIFLVGYSYTKRFTWLGHFFLRLTARIAPIGGVARGDPRRSAAILVPPLLLGLAVSAWVSCFDLIYGCQDVEFDRAH